MSVDPKRHWDGNSNPVECTAPTAEEYIEHLLYAMKRILWESLPIGSDYGHGGIAKIALEFVTRPDGSSPHEDEKSKLAGDQPTSEHVAWLRYIRSAERTQIAACDSDAPGAFKVYRHADSELDRLRSRVAELEAENRKLTEYRDQIDILRDSEYISALKFGWNLGQADNSAVFHQAIASRRREIVQARRPA